MKFHEVNGASITCVFSINSSRSGDIKLPLSPIKIDLETFKQHYLLHLHLHCQNPVENFNSHLGIHRLGILRSRTWRQPLQTHSARKASLVPPISGPTLFNGRVSVICWSLERAWPIQVENTVPFDWRKFRKFKPKMLVQLIAPTFLFSCKIS